MAFGLIRFARRKTKGKWIKLYRRGEMKNDGTHSKCLFIYYSNLIVKPKISKYLTLYRALVPFNLEISNLILLWLLFTCRKIEQVAMDQLIHMVYRKQMVIGLFLYFSFVYLVVQKTVKSEI